mgnify:CR=1 FL=1
MVKELHERKWEIDSLCYPIRLAYQYWTLTKDTSIFSADWHEAMKLVVRTLRNSSVNKESALIVSRAIVIVLQTRKSIMVGVHQLSQLD